MTKKIRCGLFETNSSGSHSITWKPRIPDASKKLDEDLYIILPQYCCMDFEMNTTNPEINKNPHSWVHKFAFLYYRLLEMAECLNDYKWCLEYMHELFRKITGKNVYFLIEVLIFEEDIISRDGNMITVECFSFWDEPHTFEVLTEDEVKKFEPYIKDYARKYGYESYNSDKSSNMKGTYFLVAQDTESVICYGSDIFEEVGIFEEMLQQNEPLMRYIGWHASVRETVPDKIYMAIIEEYVTNDNWDYLVTCDGSFAWPPFDVRNIDKNGNMYVLYFGDGTRIMISDEDELVPEYPLSIDLKITDKCSHNCPFCYENSTPDGKDADEEMLKILDTLPPGTEIAVGGGNPLECELLKGLIFGQHKHRIAVTINQKDFKMDKLYELEHLSEWEGRLNALGVSVTHVDDSFLDEINRLSDTFHIVVHVIAGIITMEELEKLYDKNIRLLILGYKDIGRGKIYKQENESVKKHILELADRIEEIKEHFMVTAFDNLALEQLGVQRKIPEKDWKVLFQGEEGEFSMYIDLVNKEFSYSSYDERRFPIKEGMTIKDMFGFLRRN